MSHNRYSAFDMNSNINKNRKRAYNILSDKNLLKSKLYKTKMCTKKNCKKKDCMYAHSKHELKPLQCFFGDDCIYKDSNNKPCPFWHPSDTITKPVINDDICIKIIDIIILII